MDMVINSIKRGISGLRNMGRMVPILIQKPFYWPLEIILSKAKEMFEFGFLFLIF